MANQVTARAHGMDTDTGQYHRDNNNKLILPSFASLTGQMDFVVIKCSEGIWVDPDFPQLWAGFGSPAPMRGVYHYQRSGVSWQQQADNVLKLLPADCQFAALDVEKINNTLDAKFFADASRILNYWRANFKGKVIYYTGPDIYMNYLLPVMTKWYPQDQWFLDFPLWVAQWPLFKPMRGPNNNPSLPKGMTAAWRFYQYTDAGDSYPYGVFGSPDLDVFNGTPADLKAFLGISDQPAPIPNPVPTPAPLAQWQIAEQSDSQIVMVKQ